MRSCPHAIQNNDIFLIAGFACQRYRIQNEGWTGNSPSCETHDHIADKTLCWQRGVEPERLRFVLAGWQAALWTLLSSISQLQGDFLCPLDHSQIVLDRATRDYLNHHPDWSFHPKRLAHPTTLHTLEVLSQPLIAVSRAVA